MNIIRWIKCTRQILPLNMTWRQTRKDLQSRSRRFLLFDAHVGRQLSPALWVWLLGFNHLLVPTTILSAVPSSFVLTVYLYSRQLCTTSYPFSFSTLQSLIGLQSHLWPTLRWKCLLETSSEIYYIVVMTYTIGETFSFIIPLLARRVFALLGCVLTLLLGAVSWCGIAVLLTRCPFFLNNDIARYNTTQRDDHCIHM